MDVYSSKLTCQPKVELMSAPLIECYDVTTAGAGNAAAQIAERPRVYSPDTWERLVEYSDSTFGAIRRRECQ
jgi:hypothetical protein